MILIFMDTFFGGGFFHEAHQIGWQIAFLESLIEPQTKAFLYKEEKKFENHISEPLVLDMQ